MQITLDRPWITAKLAAPMRVLSWSINRPGFQTTDTILWREVRNADLPPDLDVNAWFAGELAARGMTDAVAMLTSRDVTAFEEERVTIGDCTAHALATVGLSNGERVGTRLDRTGHDWGTINIAVEVDIPLSEAALIETLSIAVQARTAAVMDCGFDIPTGRVTGTGTDCVAIAAPVGDAPYAGLHTEIGHAVGRAVYDAVRRGGSYWMDYVRRRDA